MQTFIVTGPGARTENSASLQQIKAVAKGGDGDDSHLGDTLILGAGACRLAYDIHMWLGTSRTVAVDFNPLLLLVAKRVMQGDELQLYEFPIAPKSIEDFAVLRKLIGAGTGSRRISPGVRRCDAATQCAK